MSNEPKIRVLIAEDEAHLGAILEHFLRGRGYAVTMCRDGRSALDALQGDMYDVALIDIIMPELDGLEVLRQLQATSNPPEVIIITGNGTIDTAITAIKLGAYDYISKPYRMAEIDVIVRRAWEKRELSKANMFLRARLSMPTGIQTTYSQMREVVDSATALAPSDETIILHGELGAGKTYLSRYIHTRSGRFVDAYAEVSHRTDPIDLSRQLFGETPEVAGGGAPRNGIVQLAEHGTVVVDTGVLTADERAVLKDALVQRSFTRVGATHRIPLRTRMILCARPNEPDIDSFPGVHLTLPPLRERLDDVPLLASEMLQYSGHSAPQRLAEDAVTALGRYEWPGNLRELNAVLTRAAVVASAVELTAADLQTVLICEGGMSAEAGAALAELERQHIETVLQRSNWHQGRAADKLGISTKTLYRKMREYGFVRPRKRKLSLGHQME